eukprot:Lankesteria_metandrocarpae@DN7523_c0_g1_i1.p1
MEFVLCTYQPICEARYRARRAQFVFYICRRTHRIVVSPAWPRFNTPKSGLWASFSMLSAGAHTASAGAGVSVATTVGELMGFATALLCHGSILRKAEYRGGLRAPSAGLSRFCVSRALYSVGIIADVILILIGHRSGFLSSAVFSQTASR